MTRRGYLDWLRGLAVLIMIEAHILDSWTRLEDRQSMLFGWSMIAGGFGAPLFLFLAGVSVALSAGSKLRRNGDATAASRAVVRRGLQIFLLAFLFRVQAMVVSWGSWRSLLKVDILNIMGPSIMTAAALWGAARTNRGRIAALIAATLAIALLTPPVRATWLLDALPDPIEGYLRPRPGYTNFAVFPWAAFVFAGAVIGVFIDQTRTPAAERRLNARIGMAGGALVLGSYAASFLPTIYARSDFWTSSPTFFFLRTGVLTAAVAGAYLWHQRPGADSRFSPLRQMGRTSLFIYWIHIELIYGLIVRPLHKSLTLGQAWLGIPIFGLVMLVASLVKDRIVTRRSAMRD
ncbi:MAG TPA: heparan-alpha-glucosaminide N-acetyltransferase domain-containing protein [Vicinamibacterales bacterium]|nr:heparan-alpha-glucosaminide N-acetyltransferase domain-containing protein [Vicinamibacterales bacterium]